MNAKFTLFQEQIFKTFIKPGEVVEVRILGAQGKSQAWGYEYARGTISGYFDDHAPFIQCVQAADKEPHVGVYFTLQVIDSRLIGRAFNRLKPAKVTTSDQNVVAYRWLPIDIDPKRPSGISSSQAELDRALNMRVPVMEWLEKKYNFKNPIQACSGNGAHLLYRLQDLPNTDETTSSIKSILTACSDALSNSDVDIDTTVFNPARIWKLYGTTARKGDHVPGSANRAERPFRMSYIDDLSLGGEDDT